MPDSTLYENHENGEHKRISVAILLNCGILTSLSALQRQSVQKNHVVSRLSASSSSTMDFSPKLEQNIIKVSLLLRPEDCIATIAQDVFQPPQNALRCILGLVPRRRGDCLLDLLLRLCATCVFIVRRHACLADVDVRVRLFNHHSSCPA